MKLLDHMRSYSGLPCVIYADLLSETEERDLEKFQGEKKNKVLPPFP